MHYRFGLVVFYGISNFVPIQYQVLFMYIYIYIWSSIDRLFRCITTLQVFFKYCIFLDTFLFPYIYIYVCVCVWLSSSLSFKRIWLNNKVTFFPYNFKNILSRFLIIVLDSGWNWLMNLGKLSRALSDHS